MSPIFSVPYVIGYIDLHYPPPTITYMFTHPSPRTPDNTILIRQWHRIIKYLNKICSPRAIIIIVVRAFRVLVRCCCPAQFVGSCAVFSVCERLFRGLDGVEHKVLEIVFKKFWFAARMLCCRGEIYPQHFLYLPMHVRVFTHLRVLRPKAHTLVRPTLIT